MFYPFNGRIYCCILRCTHGGLNRISFSDLDGVRDVSLAQSKISHSDKVLATERGARAKPHHRPRTPMFQKDKEEAEYSPAGKDGIPTATHAMPSRCGSCLLYESNKWATSQQALWPCNNIMGNFRRTR